MISLFPFVFLFTFVTCKTFHPNQHLPVQKYQPPLRYQPLQYYPTYPTIASLPYYRPSPTKEGTAIPSSPQDISDLDRQYQQWQISPSNGQQPGVIWISAPQYSYYPPPPNGSPPNYPPPPYYPPPYPSPYPIPSTESNQTQPEILEVNPTQSRETVPTKPSPSETTSVDTSTSENFTTPTETSPTFPASPSTTTTTETPWTASPTPTTEPSTENYTITYFTTAPTNATTTTEIYTNATITEISITTTPSYTTSPTTTENATITTTTATPSSGGNATNPLLKYCKKPRGQFPSEDCSKFVNCWDDTAVEQTCPSGLYFNANKSYCDYPSNVNCTGSASSTEPTSSSSSPSSSSNTTSKCPSSYGTYRNSSNCAAFYVCVAGEPVDFYCPPGTNYNDELKVCDYPYRVNCSGIPSYPIPEESGTTIATETAPSNITTTETPVNVTSSPNVTSSSPNVITAEPNVTTSPPNVTSSPNFTTTSSPIITSSPVITTTTEASTSTIVAPQVTEEPFPSVPPPSVDPVALYNLNLKKLPESVVNTGVRCYHTNVFRLTPDCSSVTVCQDGLTYIVNCGHDTSFDAYSQKCVSSFRARC